jgi:hypothetical protein
MKTLGGCIRIASASLAALLATLGVLVGLRLVVTGVRIRLDARNPKTPQATSAIFADQLGCTVRSGQSDLTGHIAQSRLAAPCIRPALQS